MLLVIDMPLPVFWKCDQLTYLLFAFQLVCIFMRRHFETQDIVTGTSSGSLWLKLRAIDCCALKVIRVEWTIDKRGIVGSVSHGHNPA